MFRCIVHELGSMSALLRTYTRACRWGLLAALAASMSACSSFDSATRSMADTITLYRPEVVQGNFVSKEQVAALNTGMTRLQVRDTLGTPLLSSLFHHDRWDYVFTMKRQGVPFQHYRLTVYFKNDVLERFDGDEMPSEIQGASTRGYRGAVGQIPARFGPIARGRRQRCGDARAHGARLPPARARTLTPPTSHPLVLDRFS